MRRFFLSLLMTFVLTGCNSDSKTHHTSGVKIATAHDPQTLDPRMIRDLPSTTILHMLYEGLMRAEFNNKVEPGMAYEMSISPDNKTYTFKLRDAVWSNGDPVTAYDFEKTWKGLLDPDFPAPNAYQLYVIRGAKDYKEGRGIIKEVGVRALDNKTLEVTLDQPVPYFLELLTTHFFMPVHSDIRTGKQSDPITNGPFKLESWKRNSELSVIKNPYYWDAPKVHLEKIDVLVIDDHTALQMFKNDELDWAGSPMSDLPQDSLTYLKDYNFLRRSPAAGTHWFRFNTASKPFNNEKMRKAFAYALDRKAIVDNITQGNQTPATGIVPPVLGLDEKPFFDDNDTIEAWDLFQDALVEEDLDVDQLPPITLCYKAGDRNHKIAQAVQHEWKKTLGIDVRLESCEAKTLFEKLARKDYQISAGSWFADFADPINFLDVFKSRENPTNNTDWEDAKYVQLLEESAQQSDPEQRRATLKEAETVLINQMPVAPLFYAVFNYIKNDNLYGVYFSELGYLDFKYAYYAFDESPE